MAMKQIVLKLNTGAKIPAIALGTWLSAKGEVAQAVKQAIEVGYRHIDCAHVYGNEAEIGEALKEVFATGKVEREDVFITSKLWNTSHLPDDVMPACQESLKNLQLDYLDLYLIHLPMAFKKGSGFVRCKADGVVGYNPQAMQQTWKAMEELVSKGLCKAIGVSNFSSKKVTSLLETATIVPACNQVELHPYLPQPKLKEFCDSKGILLEGYSPLGAPGRPYPEETKQAEPKVLEEPVLKEIAQKHNCTVAQVALRWGMQRGYPVLPKSTSSNRIKENLESLNIELTEEDMKAINGITIHKRYLPQTWMYKPGEQTEDFWDGEA